MKTDGSCPAPCIVLCVIETRPWSWFWKTQPLLKIRKTLSSWQAGRIVCLVVLTEDKRLLGQKQRPFILTGKVAARAPAFSVSVPQVLRLRSSKSDTHMQYGLWRVPHSKTMNLLYWMARDLIIGDSTFPGQVYKMPTKRILKQVSSSAHEPCWSARNL